MNSVEWFSQNPNRCFENKIPSFQNFTNYLFNKTYKILLIRVNIAIGRYLLKSVFAPPLCNGTTLTILRMFG